MPLPGYSRRRMLSIVSGLGGSAGGAIVGVAEGTGELGASVGVCDALGSFVTSGLDDGGPKVQAVSIAAPISSMPKNKFIQVRFWFRFWLIPKLFAGQLTIQSQDDMLRTWIFQFSTSAMMNWVKSGYASTFTRKVYIVPSVARV